MVHTEAAETIMSTDTTAASPRSATARDDGGRNSYDGIEDSFRALAELDAADPRRARLREQIIADCMPLAAHIARRYEGRGQSREDLQQVANLALVLSVDRYDVSRGAPFLGFAVPTIMGEVRRYFRDSGWAVKVPRRMKELRARISQHSLVLSQQLGREPSSHELARALDVPVEEVVQATVAANSYLCDSLDETQSAESDSPTPLGARLAVDEPRYEFTEDAITVKPLIEALPEQERKILIQRFYENKTQSEIAALHGISQMQVSRILSRVLSGLRDQALAEPTRRRHLRAVA